MRKVRFTFVCDDKERHKIATLATKLQRSDSDIVRLGIAVLEHTMLALEASHISRYDPISLFISAQGVSIDSQQEL